MRFTNHIFLLKHFYIMNKKLLLSFALAAAMAGCINDADVPSGNGDNPISGAKGGNMEISFVVPNSSNGSRAASAELWSL